MKISDLSPRTRAALAFTVPSILILLAIPALFREAGHRPVDPGNTRGGAMLAAPQVSGDSGRGEAPVSAAAAPPASSPLPLPSENLSAPTGSSAASAAGPAASASAPAAAAAPAAPAAAGGAAAASMPASAGSLPPGSGAARLLAAAGGMAGSAGGMAGSAGGPNMGGSAGPASYQGGQMGQVQGYNWSQPRLKTTDSQYGARAVLGGGANPEVSGVSGAAITGGGAPAGGRAGGMTATGSGGFGAQSSGGFGAGGDAGGSGSAGAGDSEGGDEFEGEKIPDIPPAEPLPPNPSNAQLAEARKKCDAAGQVYGPMMDQTGDYLSGLRGCDSKKCKRRARAGCSRLNNIDCRNKRACPFTVNDACGNTCSI